MNDPVVDARDLVADVFPRARWALLTGSVTTAARTAGSDLDIVVLLPDGDRDAPHRDSRRFRGWPVELFVHDEQTLTHYLTRELAAGKPSLHRMVGTGIVLVGDPVPWTEHCARVLADGPPPLAEADRQRIRYGLTDLLDDLAHATDPGERSVIAAYAWRSAGEATLSLNDRWTGAGKWILRELRQFDPDTAARWLAAKENPQSIMDYARELLAQHGGPLFEGYRANGDRPPSDAPRRDQSPSDGVDDA